MVHNCEMQASVAETARLTLRRFEQTDAAFIVELLGDRDFVRNIGDRGVRNHEDARRYIASGPIASYERHGFGLYAVELRATAVVMGMCGLLRRDSHPDVEIGFAFLPRFRGRGYALEAARATLQLAIGNMGLRRLVAITAPNNQSSMRVLLALGFRFERPVHLTGESSESRLFVFERSAAAP